MLRTRWALAALLAACLFGGCNDDEPKPDLGSDPTSSTPTASASVSTSPTPTPTPIAGPRQAVDAWLAAWTLAMKSGSTDNVAELSAKACESCQRLIEQVANIYEKGGRLETEGWRATRVSEAPDSVAATPSFVMQVVQSRQVLYGEGGKVVDDTSETTVPMRMTFAPQEQNWILEKLEILK